MIAYTFLVVLTLVVAYFEARQDASDIKKHLRIDHAAQLWERARLLGVLVFCTIVGSCWENGAVKWEWRALFFLPICWAVFTVAFRLLLNRMRALPAFYCSPSNVYDYLFIACSWSVEYSWRWPQSRKHAIQWFADLYDPNWTGQSTFMKVIHRAGLAQYIAETLILALSTWGYIHYTNT